MISISILSTAYQYFRPNLTLSLWKKLFAKKEPVLLETPLERLALFIRNNSHEYDTIFVWGLYPEIYALSNRLPASRYLISIALTGFVPGTDMNLIADVADTENTIIPGSWKIFINEISNNPPLYIIDTSFDNIGYNGK